MRITNNMLINNMIGYIGNNLGRMERYQNQLATGKKITVPSDDPVVAARALKLRTDVSEVDQYQRNVKDATSWLDVTETALSNMGDVLQRARELAVQASNGTNTPNDTAKVSEEVKQLRTQLIHLGNSTYAGRYIFSGFKTDKKLINDDESDTANFGTFNIDVATNSENISYEIGIGDNITINVAGGDLFNLGGNAAAGTHGTTAVSMGPIVYPLTISNTDGDFSATIDGAVINANIQGTYNNKGQLAAAIETAINTAIPAGMKHVGMSVTASGIQLTSGSLDTASSIDIDTSSAAAVLLGMSVSSQTTGTPSDTGSLVEDFNSFITDLQTGDLTGISNMIDTIDKHMNNLLRIRADVGARQNRVELTSNRLENDNINFTKLMSENEDVDMAETIMNLQNEENVYKASLAGGAKIIMPTLVDFLR